MNILTLFNAYQIAEHYKQNACDNRGTNMGIAVKDDHYALVYQRYERLAFKLEQRIRKAMGKPMYEWAHKTCWFCGFPDDSHTHACRRWQQEAQR